jgi:hypothetical protein
MAHRIGFIKEDYENKDTEQRREEVKETVIARKSVVQVYFPDKDRSFSYYNDQFDLQCGDLVFVEGKLEGVRGRVTEVNYNFKIKLADYKRVIAVADTNVEGEFCIAGSHFVTFAPNVLPKEKVLSWFKAPSQEEEYAYGGDETWYSLECLADLPMSKEIKDRGYEYYVQNKVRYLCVDGDRGYALVEGSEIYEVEFSYRDHEVSNLVCSCFCSYDCKHEFATMLQLQETLEKIETHYQDEFQRSGYFAAVLKGMLFAFVVDKREKGKMVL